MEHQKEAEHIWALAHRPQKDYITKMPADRLKYYQVTLISKHISIRRDDIQKIRELWNRIKDCTQADLKSFATLIAQESDYLSQEDIIGFLK